MVKLNHDYFLLFEYQVGFPTIKIIFQENGPYLAGWDSNTEKTFLLPNRHSWNSNHNMLYIDNPVGTGFSFTDKEEGFPTTDEQVAVDLMEAIRQFMLVLPVRAPDRTSSFYFHPSIHPVLF